MTQGSARFARFTLGCLNWVAPVRAKKSIRIGFNKNGGFVGV
jgi:hypothetical protein